MIVRTLLYLSNNLTTPFLNKPRRIQDNPAPSLANEDSHDDSSIGDIDEVLAV
jgi:hypothetical protein